MNNSLRPRSLFCQILLSKTVHHCSWFSPKSTAHRMRGHMALNLSLKSQIISAGLSYGLHFFSFFSSGLTMNETREASLRSRLGRQGRRTSKSRSSATKRGLRRVSPRRRFLTPSALAPSAHPSISKREVLWKSVRLRRAWRLRASVPLLPSGVNLVARNDKP